MIASKLRVANGTNASEMCHTLPHQFTFDKSKCEHGNATFLCVRTLFTQFIKHKHLCGPGRDDPRRYNLLFPRRCGDLMTSGSLLPNACPFNANMTPDPHVVPQAEHNFLNLVFVSTPVSYAMTFEW